MKCNRRKLLIPFIGCLSAFLYFVWCYVDTGMNTGETPRTTPQSMLNTSVSILKAKIFTERLSHKSRNHDPNHKFQQRFPRIFIIGFGKTGTRALFDTLLFHSKVIRPYREMRFFDQYYQLGINWYLHQMPQAKNGQQIAEKSPCYILDPAVPKRLIKAAGMFSVVVEELKFVVMFRHPIVRAISEYLEWQSLRASRHSKPLGNFDDLALDKYGQVSDFRPINHSVYAHYLKQWLQIFNPNQFCYVSGDTFHEHPNTVVSKLEKCLKLSPEITKDNFVWDDTRKLHCLSHNGVVTCPSLSKGRAHPFIQQEVVNALMKFYKPYNEELYSITGENYGWENDYNGLNIM